MAYANIARQREYQKLWMAARRKQWLDVHGPCGECGSTDRLEVDHIDPALKETHRVWSLSEKKREAELAKCRVLCHDCHRVRHAAPHGAYRYRFHGCRCALCTKAHCDRMRAYRNRKTMPRPSEVTA